MCAVFSGDVRQFYVEWYCCPKEPFLAIAYRRVNTTKRIIFYSGKTV